MPPRIPNPPQIGLKPKDLTNIQDTLPPRIPNPPQIGLKQQIPKQAKNQNRASNTESTSNRIETGGVKKLVFNRLVPRIPNPPQIGLKPKSKRCLGIRIYPRIPNPPQIGLKLLLSIPARVTWLTSNTESTSNRIETH